MLLPVPCHMRVWPSGQMCEMSRLLLIDGVFATDADAQAADALWPRLQRIKQNMGGLTTGLQQLGDFLRRPVASDV